MPRVRRGRHRGRRALRDLRVSPADDRLALRVLAENVLVRVRAVPEGPLAPTSRAMLQRAEEELLAALRLLEAA